MFQLRMKKGRFCPETLCDICLNPITKDNPANILWDWPEKGIETIEFIVACKLTCSRNSEKYPLSHDLDSHLLMQLKNIGITTNKKLDELMERIAHLSML